MEIDEDFVLPYGERLTLSKTSGYSVIEYSRHPDKDLDNIIEVWKYDKRKSKKGGSSWITTGDLYSNIKSFDESYNQRTLETIPKKSDKK
jgi:hypothetical protein